jgi:hypothetical protein
MDCRRLRPPCKAKAALRFFHLFNVIGLLELIIVDYKLHTQAHHCCQHTKPFIHDHRPAAKSCPMPPSNNQTSAGHDPEDAHTFFPTLFYYFRIMQEQNIKWPSSNVTMCFKKSGIIGHPETFSSVPLVRRRKGEEDDE